MDDKNFLDIKVSLAEIAGEQKLQSQRLDHLSEMLEKDVTGLKADNATLRRELSEKVSKDRFAWVERASYAALAGIVATWIKLTFGA